MSHRLVLAGLAIGAFACTGIPYQQPMEVSPVVPKRGEGVVVDDAIMLFDASASINSRSEFPGEKALLESFVASMPEGGYEVGAIAFGGEKRETQPLAAFQRAGLAEYAHRVPHLDGTTPLPVVLAESRERLAGRSDRAAVVLFSDGKPSNTYGGAIEDALTLDAAKQLVESYGGDVCIHTVQTGDDPEVSELLRRLAEASPCGSSRNADSLRDVAGLQSFQREVFFGAAAAPALAAPTDRDGDGVLDAQDQCPDTPAGAEVDPRGCWVLEWLYFATDSAALDADAEARLKNEVLPVLGRNPDLRLRVDGHTDSQGGEAYNERLSERRAVSVRDFLVNQGVAPERLESRGFGEGSPIAANDTAGGRRQNRRTELTAIR